MVFNMLITECEIIRKNSQITTRKFAKLVGLTPARYCDLKFFRSQPTEKEIYTIKEVLKKIKNLK